MIENEYILFPDRPDPLERLPALAERLGVNESKDKAGWCLVTKAGRYYNMFDLIIGVLDYVDKGKQ